MTTCKMNLRGPVSVSIHFSAIFWINFYFYFKKHHLVYVYGCFICVYSDHGACKREEDPLELELHTGGCDHHVDTIPLAPYFMLKE